MPLWTLVLVLHLLGRATIISSPGPPGQTSPRVQDTNG